MDSIAVDILDTASDRRLGEGRVTSRQRGPKPKLSDSEVFTIEVVGELLGTYQGLYTFFLTELRWVVPGLGYSP